MANELRIAGLDSFRPTAERVQLPSQAGTDEAVLLRRPDLVSLMANGDGDVPDVLSNLILGMLQTTEGRQGKAQRVEITAENLPDVMRSLNVIALATFAEPRLTPASEPEGDAVPVHWLSFADKAWVFSWALGGEQAVAAQRFPDAADGRAGAVPAVQGIPPNAKRSRRAKR